MKLAKVQNQERDEELSRVLNSTSVIGLCQNEFFIGLQSVLGEFLRSN